MPRVSRLLLRVNVVGSLLVIVVGIFLVGCPLAAAALLSFSVSACRWLQPHFAVSAAFDCDRWSCRVAQPVRCTPLWPASWLPALDKSRGSKSVEVQRVWEVYDDRLRFMSRSAGNRLTRSLLDGDVSSAESALADAYCFSGGPVPDRGLVLGRGTARLRVVRLGGPKVRKVRGNAVDPVDGRDVHLYRDSSLAPLLGLRRRLFCWSFPSCYYGGFVACSGRWLRWVS